MDIHVINCVPEVSLIDDHDPGTLFAEVDCLLDLTPIAGISPAGISGITNHKIVGLGGYRSTHLSAQLDNGVRNLGAFCPVEFSGKAEGLILEGDLRADSTDAANAVGFPEFGNSFSDRL